VDSIRTTPLIAVPDLGAGVALKLENLQVTGSFKVRGAWRRLATLSKDERARGVVAASAGNHGMGTAFAARELGVAATIVVPASTPAVKRNGIEALGGAVIVDGHNYDASEVIARRLAQRTGAVFVSPFDDEEVIAGNGGDLAAELHAQAPDLKRVVCPVGGGGLIGGIARALQPHGVSVIGVEPEANCAMYESLQRGAALTEYDGGETLAEGCEGAVCERTFQLVRDHADGVERISEAAIRRAVAWCYRTAGTIVECSAAVAVAGMLEGVVAPTAAGTTAIVVTGGNIDPERLDEILARG